MFARGEGDPLCVKDRNPFNTVHKHTHKHTQITETQHINGHYRWVVSDVCRRLYFVGAKEEEDEDAAVLANRHHLFVVQTEIDGDYGLRMGGDRLQQTERWLW